ncbi:20S proteasome subunit alpha 4 [Nematocida homosporus]|uniref:20S proteasome subunit alpha 4 n=1 Tax=Nematocida homosporus TaxID=1912981 RepID=UPI0022212697|nr:20S proteasome subunit alpha 4 [Nematocida homosporus]KAI5187496.1 20S proteasome subunit alpha 4 [Nematocida homosporus]
MSKYDRALSIFSPNGRIFQVEYAQLASERGSPVIFYSNQQSIAVAIEKRAESKNRILSDLDKFKEVESGIYLSFAGIYPDCLVIIDQAILIARQYAYDIGERIDIKKLAQELGDYLQKFTITGGCRPFGAKIVLFGFDSNGPVIALVEPDGNYSFYIGGAIGQKSDKATEYLETATGSSPTQIVAQALFNTAQKDPQKMTIYEISPEVAQIMPTSAISDLLSDAQ